jgi:Tol biopolymer transport system component
LTDNASTTALDSSPVWSPNGAKIAFVRRAAAVGPNTSPKIFVVNADGSGAQQLSDNNPVNHDVKPDWSPDSTKIVFERDNQGYDFQATVVTMDADGSNVQPLVSGNDPAWSPDGTKIVYAGLGNNQIFTMNADGTGQTLIANIARASEFALDWQPLK